VPLGAMRESLRSGDPFERWKAAMALLDLGPQAAGAADALIAALGDPAREVRCAAILALGEIGAAAEPALPILVRLADPGEAPTVHHCAIRALGGIPSREAERVLVRMLESQASLDQAVHALVRRDDLSTEAVSALYDALSRHCRQGTADAILARLAQLRERFLVETRARLSLQGDCFDPSLACRMVSALGPDGKEFLPDLTAILKADPQDLAAALARRAPVRSEDSMGRITWARPVAAGDTVGSGALPVLNALASIGPVPDDVAQLAMSKLRGLPEGCHYAVVRSLPKLCVDRSTLLAHLDSMAGETSLPMATRVLAVQALGQLGPEARPLLEKHRTSEELSKASDQALVQTGLDSIPTDKLLDRLRYGGTTVDLTILYHVLNRPLDGRQVQALIPALLALTTKGQPQDLQVVSGVVERLRITDPALVNAVLAQPAEMSSHAYEQLLRSIGKAGGFGPDQVSGLMARLDSPSRGAVTETLVSMGTKVVPALAKAARSNRAATRDAVIAVLAEMGPLGEPTLIELTQDGDGEIAEAAVAAMGSLRSISSASVAAIRAAGESPSWRLRYRAASAAGSVTGLTGGAELDEWRWQVLRGLLDDAETATRVNVAATLIREGRDVPAAMRVARECLNSGDPAVHERAAGLLMSPAAAGEDTDATIAQFVEDPDEDVRAMATLAQGRRAADAIDEGLLQRLGALLDDPDYRRAACSVLEGLGPRAQAVGDRLAEQIRNCPDERFPLAETLATVAPEDERAFEALAQLVERSSVGPARAMDAYVWYGATSRAAVTVLARRLADRTGDWRSVCLCEIAGRLGPHSADAGPALIGSLDAPTPGICEKVVRSLILMGVDPEPAVLHMLPAIRSGADKTAFVALGFLGEKARDAVPALMDQWVLQEYPEHAEIGRLLDQIRGLVPADTVDAPRPATQPKG